MTITISYFAAEQNTVFIPAMLAVLVATIALCLPVMFGAGLRRHHRLVPARVAAAMVAAVGVAGAAFLAVPAFGTLAAERANVQSELRDRFGISLTSAQVGEAIDGGKPLIKDADLAAKVGLNPPAKGWKGYSVRLIATAEGADTYTVEYGEKPVQPTT